MIQLNLSHITSSTLKLQLSPLNYLSKQKYPQKMCMFYNILPLYQKVKTFYTQKF